MGRNIRRNISILIITLLLIFSVQIITDSVSATSADELQSQGKQWLDKGKQNSVIDDTVLTSTFVPIARILSVVGTVVVVVVTLIMAIKYMTTNPEEQGKLKQQLVGLVIATIVIFAAQAIWAITYNFFKDF